MRNYKKLVLNLVLLVTVAAVAGLLFPVAGDSFSLFSRYTSVKEHNGEIRIAINEVNDGNAHYYSYEDAGKTIKFFIIKSRDGMVRAAFDACDVCFPAKKGYTQEGEFMICTNCGRRFHASQVNVVEGGCNPAPLARKTVGDQLVIRIDDLKSGSRYF